MEASVAQSWDTILAARLQVRPVPSSSTFSDFTMPSSTTMENLKGGWGRRQRRRMGEELLVPGR